MLGIVQCIDMRPAKLRTEFAQRNHTGLDADFYLDIQLGEFLSKSIMKLNCSGHNRI